MKPIESDFFARDTVLVAQELLGKVIVVGDCVMRIVETEAYRDDAASHAHTKTGRSAIMYDTYGHVYVYFIYGMYFCLNFTTETKGMPGAVLIRAGEPLQGIEMMMTRRGVERKENLCSGPGKLCQALGITNEHNGQQIGSGMVRLFDDGYVVERIGRSRRVGISRGRHLFWRFFVNGNKWVSR